MAALQTRLHEVEQELATTKKALADTQQKYQNSQLEVQTLHTQLDSVNQQLAALKSSQSVDQNMGELMARNKELTERLASAQTEIKALTSSPKSAAAKLAVQLKLVQEKLDASEAANAGLTETTTNLQHQLDQAQHDLAAANAQLAASGPGSPQYLALKRENEVMRGILQRELQEQSRRDGAKRLAQEEFDRLKITSRVLQEQLDILGSPMTPPNNDEERTLLANIKVAPSEVTPLVDAGDTGNHFSATPGGTPISESNMPSGEMPATNAAPVAVNPPADTNAAPAVVTDTNAAPAVTGTNTPTVATADTNAAPTASTNTISTNTAVASTPDTNAPSATNAAPVVATDTNSSTPPAITGTNAPNVAATDTNTAPVPAATDTNAPGTAAPPAAPSTATTTNATPAIASDTNAAPATSTNTSTATNTATASTPPADQSAASHPADAARYSNEPRLPPDMREIAQEATDFFENKHYDEAAAKFQTIIDKYPESIYAWSNLGVVRSQQGRLPEAAKALQHAVKLSPNDAVSYRNLGTVYFQQNRNDEAIDALERSIALEPNNFYSHDYLGCACSQKGWEEVAEKEFRKAIEINPDIPDAHYNLAIIYAVQKPPALELARREYKKSLDLGLPREPRLEKLLGL